MPDLDAAGLGFVVWKRTQLAVRALGLDSGPMGGFDRAKVGLLFAEHGWRWMARHFFSSLGQQ